MNEKTLASGLNNIFADRVSLICARDISTYGHGDWAKIRIALQKWEQQGFIRIISNPETAEDLTPCVEMFKYITIQ
jgi:hypothetical protein